MIPERDFTDYLKDIRDNALSAASFVRDMRFEDFRHDLRTQYAVIRALEIIGEATKQIPANVRRRQDGVPWKEMAAMRDRLINGYPGIDLEIVWRTAKLDLPKLQTVLDRVVEDELRSSGQ